jgi:large subunit ribosomal protein L4
MSPYPPTEPGSPLVVRYPFAIEYYKDREAVVYDLAERPLGLVSLPGAAFNVPVRIDILHRVARYWRAKWQQGTHKAKSRAEVRGGGRKPWPQKKTGRARQGSIRSPLWKGGGVPHPPRPRSHAHSLPRAVRLLGMRCALSARINEGRFFVVDDFLTIRGLDAPAPTPAAALPALPHAAADPAAAPSPLSSEPQPLARPSAASPPTSSAAPSPAASASAASRRSFWRTGPEPGAHVIREYRELKARLAALTEGVPGSTWLLVDSGDAGPDGGARLRKLLK